MSDNLAKLHIPLIHSYYIYFSHNYGCDILRSRVFWGRQRDYCVRCGGRNQVPGSGPKDDKPNFSM